MMAPDVPSGAITFGFDSCASRASSRLIVEVDIGELLAAVVAHDEARVLLFDGPRRREATGGHVASVCSHSPMMRAGCSRAAE